MLNGLIIKRGVPIDGNFTIPLKTGIDYTGCVLQIIGKLNVNDNDSKSIINITSNNGGIVPVLSSDKITATYKISGEATADLPANRVTAIHYELNLTYQDEDYSHVLELGRFAVVPRVKLTI